MNEAEERQGKAEPVQNAEFIRDTYRKAVITGRLTILSFNINAFVDGILVGRRIGPDAVTAINLSLPVYWALCVGARFSPPARRSPPPTPSVLATSGGGAHTLTPVRTPLCGSRWPFRPLALASRGPLVARIGERTNATY